MSPKAVDEDSLTDPSLKSKYFFSSLRLSLVFPAFFFLLQIFSTLFGNKVPLSGASHENYQALWFERSEDRITGEMVHIYKGGYWEAKERGKWEGCPDIF